MKIRFPNTPTLTVRRGFAWLPVFCEDDCVVWLCPFWYFVSPLLTPPPCLIRRSFSTEWAADAALARRLNLPKPTPESSAGSTPSGRRKGGGR